MQTKWGRTVLAFRRVRRESPIVLEFLVVIVILAIFLGLDIGYLTTTHKKDMHGLEVLHQKQLKDLKDQFEGKIKELDQKSDSHKGEFIAQHREHSTEMRDKQRQTLEAMVMNLNTKLKDLVNGEI